MAASKLTIIIERKKTKKKFNIIIIFYRSFTNAQANNKGLTIVKRMTQNKAERNSLPKKYPKKEAIKFILFGVYNFSGIFFFVSSILCSFSSCAEYHLLLCVWFQFQLSQTF